MRTIKILVRLPNWLGDLVMAAGFMEQLAAQYPGAEISVIVKKGLEGLLPLFPAYKHCFVFDKAAHPGVRGAWRFGRTIKSTELFDLFFCLPDSFSSALMVWASGAPVRIGYKKELRNFLLSHAYEKPSARHRVLGYLNLLECYSGHKLELEGISLKQHRTQQKAGVVVNINSEAQSRRLTVAKAVSLLTELQAATSEIITLIGSPKEVPFVHEVLKNLPAHRFENKAGKTSLPQLAQVLARAQVLLTTDSGPAHLANALGTFTIVLFGAGNEAETAPYNTRLRSVIRLGKLSCEPCEKNVCARFATPQCLEQLNTQQLVQEVVNHLQYTQQ